jgi:hypothetical protein
MTNIITGDTTKGIKGIGELALRISKFDSYRLFTLYENVGERKVMNVSGDQKYYLVFKSPKKEIRIPEYDPKGFFEVDKVNGCILFKITKKNAEDILSMKTAGEKIFHIVRVFEEKDEFGKILNVTDEVEVYNGKWGDDYAFSTFSTENKVDLLSKALAAQVDKNANILTEYNDLQKKYNDEVNKSAGLEKDIVILTAERDSLKSQVNEYLGDTYNGNILSTDTKYIAFESALDNVSFTEEQLASAMASSIGKEGFDMSEDVGGSRVELDVKVYGDDVNDLKITIYRNGITLGSAVYNMGFNQFVYAKQGDSFKFECTGMTSRYSKVLSLKYYPSAGCEKFIVTTIPNAEVSDKIEKSIVTGIVDYGKDNEIVQPTGVIGKLMCYVE